jgi:hypothetical protein
MRQLLRYNCVALPLLITAMVGLLACLLLSGHAPLWWLAEIAPMFTLLIMATCAWLLLKLAIWATKSLTLRWLVTVGLIVAGISFDRHDIVAGAAIMLIVSSGYWWLRAQIRPSDLPATREETLYWYWVNEFTDGRTPFLPRKPRSLR